MYPVSYPAFESHPVKVNHTSLTESRNFMALKSTTLPEPKIGLPDLPGHNIHESIRD